MAHQTQVLRLPSDPNKAAAELELALSEIITLGRQSRDSEWQDLKLIHSGYISAMTKLAPDQQMTALRAAYGTRLLSLFSLSEEQLGASYAVLETYELWQHARKTPSLASTLYDRAEQVIGNSDVLKVLQLAEALAANTVQPTATIEESLRALGFSRILELALSKQLLNITKAVADELLVATRKSA